MHFEIQYNPAHSLATAHLNPGESIRAEASAMVSMSHNIEVETNTGPQGQGGFLRKAKRSFFGGESFFQNTYRARSPGAMVSLAPRLCGSMVVHELAGGPALLVQASSYVAAPDQVDIDSRFQGFKGFFSGESLFFLRASGFGPLLLNAFGAIETLDLDGELIVDTGHLVAFTEGIDYSIDKAGGGWIQSFLSGEGLVLRLRGRGKLYIQSRNPNEFGAAMGRLLPARQA
jgi:uncharacterized protein (TIGR00266 family)